MVGGIAAFTLAIQSLHIAYKQPSDYKHAHNEKICTKMQEPVAFCKTNPSQSAVL